MHRNRSGEAAFLIFHSAQRHSPKAVALHCHHQCNSGHHHCHDDYDLCDEHELV